MGSPAKGALASRGNPYFFSKRTKARKYKLQEGQQRAPAAARRSTPSKGICNAGWCRAKSSPNAIACKQNAKCWAQCRRPHANRQELGPPARARRRKCQVLQKTRAGAAAAAAAAERAAAAAAAASQRVHTVRGFQGSGAIIARRRTQGSSFLSQAFHTVPAPAGSRQLRRPSSRPGGGGRAPPKTPQRARVMMRGPEGVGAAAPRAGRCQQNATDTPAVHSVMHAGA